MSIGLFVFAAVMSARALAPPDVAGETRFSIDAGGREFLLGEPILLIAGIRNRTGTQIEFSNDYFQIIRRVTRDGKDVPVTAYGRIHVKPHPGLSFGGPVKVAPHETYRRDIPLTLAFDMTLPGTYIIHLDDHYVLNGKPVNCTGLARFKIVEEKLEHSNEESKHRVRRAKVNRWIVERSNDTSR